MRIKRILGLTSIVGIAALSVTFVAFAAGIFVVAPGHVGDWSTADTRPGGSVNFVGDSFAPSGNGALQLLTDGTTAAKAQYMHPANVALSSVSSLSYWAKQVGGPAIAGPSYQLVLCLGGFDGATCTGFTTMVFEPYQSNGCCNAVQSNVWEYWDVTAGKMWSSRAYSDGDTCSVVAGGGGPPIYTLTQLQTSCPDATAIGFGVNVGTFNPNYNVYTDLVEFNGDFYDFEPFMTATDKDQCKNNGWKTLFRADGTPFKNQGACVSYVASGGKSG